MTAHWRERQRPGERPSECQRITIRLGGSRVSRLFGTAQGAAGKPAGPTHRKPVFMTACVPGGHAWLPSFALTGGLPPVVAAFLLFAKPGHPLLASLLLTTRSKRKSPASSSGLPQLRGGPAGSRPQPLASAFTNDEHPAFADERGSRLLLRSGRSRAQQSRRRPCCGDKGVVSLKTDHGHPALGAGALVIRICPVRAATASSTRSMPRHSAARRNSVVRSGAAEHRGEDGAIVLDSVQYLPALTDPDDGPPEHRLSAPRWRHRRPCRCRQGQDPRPTLCGEIGCRRRRYQRGETPGHGLGDDQRRVIGRDHHAVGEFQVVRDLARCAVRGHQRDDPRRGRLAREEADADAVDIKYCRGRRPRSRSSRARPPRAGRRAGPSTRWLHPQKLLAGDQQAIVGQPIDRPAIACDIASHAKMQKSPQWVLRFARLGVASARERPAANLASE